MVEVTEIQPNVSLLTWHGKKVYLVGTAHVSQASADLAEQLIREIKPDVVAIELCEPRFNSLRNPDRWKNTDLVSVIRQGKAYVLMAQLMMAAFQKKLGEQLKIKPGAEMLSAAKVADELAIPTVLADREVTITLKRTWGALGFWSMCKIVVALISGLFTKHQIDVAEIERLKNSDALNEMMKELSDVLPEVRKTLIDERDQFLAARIAHAPGETVVAVMGAGHVPGIIRYLDKEIDLVALSELPKPRLAMKILGWAVPSAMLALIVAGFFVSGAATSVHMVVSWIVITGSFAALGSLVSLGHPLTILTAFVASPITTIHPFLASGWFAGLVEALVRKPRVGDLEHITDDIATFRGLWRNRVSRVLMVMSFTNLFGSVGALWGLKVVASML